MPCKKSSDIATFERTVGSIQYIKVDLKFALMPLKKIIFSSTVIGETFQENHELNFDDKYLIYMLKCKICEKQYVGETHDLYRLKWNKLQGQCRKVSEM